MKHRSKKPKQRKTSFLAKKSSLRGEIRLIRGRHLKLYNSDLDRYFRLSRFQQSRVVPGDSVECRINLRGWAQITKIMRRQKFSFLCSMEKRNGKLFGIPLDLGQNSKIRIRGKVSKNLTRNDLIQVILEKKVTIDEPLTGRIESSIKSDDLTQKANQIAIAKFNLRYEWNKNIFNETKRLENIRLDQSERRDLTDLDFVTIDGKNAKDFDDAICVDEKSDSFDIYVAIADVSHFVEPGSFIDQEAYERSTSIYFRGKVIPMLPEKISNDLCSLRPDKERLVLVCKASISTNGDFIDAVFFEAKICSRARLEYENISKAIEKDNYPKDLSKMLRSVTKVYEILRRKRAERGALDLNVADYRPVFDSKNKLSKFEKTETFIANKIIEELMLLANICAAELLISSKIPAIYRVHPKPDFAQIKQLEGFLRSRNLNIKLSETAKVKEFADILMQVKDRNDSEILSMGMLQNLNLAIYQREPKEHFALAYNSYTHFTSPIRRYPDLMVHRAIKSLIKNNHKKEISIKDNNEGLLFESYDYSKEQIDEITASCSEKERIAESASRDSFDTLRCELASKHIGKIFKGKVSHIAEFGVFVKIEKLNIEGLCHVKNLPGNDYYLYDPITKSLTTRYSKKGFYLGDSMQIKIKQVETLNQRIDLEIVK